MRHVGATLFIVVLIGAGCRMGATVARTEPLSAEAFLRQAAAERGAVRTESGAIWKELKRGTGASARADETVTVQYQAALHDGTPLDTVFAQVPITLPLSGLPPCWMEALDRLRVGGAGRIVCPAHLARRRGDDVSPIPDDAAVVLSVQLIDVGQPLPPRSH